MTVIAPAALACTFLTSIAGAATYGLLALTTTGDIAPHWTTGLLCGAGGLIGGYLGAHLQPRLPERILRILLGGLATILACLYLAQSIGQPSRNTRADQNRNRRAAPHPVAGPVDETLRSS
jgi:uncharacterized membrane protein YfcA